MSAGSTGRSGDRLRHAVVNSRDWAGSAPVSLSGEELPFGVPSGRSPGTSLAEVTYAKPRDDSPKVDNAVSGERVLSRAKVG